MRRRIDTRPTIPRDHPVSRTFGELQHVVLPATQFVRVRMWWSDDAPVREVVCDTEGAAHAFMKRIRQAALEELETIWSRCPL